jgi:acetate kinase
METEAALCSGLVERIGESMGNLVYKAAPGTDHEKKVAKEQSFPNHTVGMQAVMALLIDPASGRN